MVRHIFAMNRKPYLRYLVTIAIKMVNIEKLMIMDMRDMRLKY